MLQTFHWKLLGSFSFFLYKIFICCNFQGRSVLIGVFASGRAEGGGHPLDKGGARKTYLKTLINFFRFLTQGVPLDSLDSEPLIFFSQSIFQPSEEKKTFLSFGRISKNANQVHLFFDEKYILNSSEYTYKYF